MAKQYTTSGYMYGMSSPQRPRKTSSSGYSYSAMLNKVMQTIKDDPTLLFLVLQDDELSRWWKMRQNKNVAQALRAEEKRKEKEENARLAAIKKTLLNTLTEDEKKALGLSTKTKNT